MKNNRKISRSEFTSRKIMLVFALALAGVLLLMLVHRSMQTVGGYLFMQTALKVLALLCVPAFACGAWLTRRTTQKPGESRRQLFGGMDIMAVSLAALVSCLLLLYVESSMSVKFLYVLIPGLAVLYLIQAVFQREFFIISAFSVAAGVLLWLICRVPATAAQAITAAGLVISLLFAAFTLLLRRGDGVLRMGEKRQRVLPAGGEYGAMLISSGVSFLLFAVGLILSLTGIGGLCAYLVYILFAYVFILAVYYTVKLM